MRQIINLLIMAAIVVATCWGCSPKSFSGVVTEIKSDTVCIPKQCFLLLSNAPKTKVGNKAVFMKTKDKKKVNCKRIK